MNEAAKQLYLSQPSLPETVMSLEEEIGVELFIRTNRGIRTTVEGEETLSYARQVVEQYRLLDDKYIKPYQQQKEVLRLNAALYICGQGICGCRQGVRL